MGNSANTIKNTNKKVPIASKKYIITFFNKGNFFAKPNLYAMIIRRKFKIYKIRNV